MPPPHESLRASWGPSLSLRHSAAGIAALALEGTLVARLAEQVHMQTGRSPSPAEVRSWERSLPILAQDLVRAGLDQVEVILEMRLPLSSKRIDAVLAGLHPKTRKPSYVVVELKQWSRASAWEGDPNLVTVDHAAGPRLHPVLQVRGYCDYLVDFTRSLHDRPEQVVGAAYLHNATSEGDVLDLFDLPADPHGRLFTAARRSAWLEFLQERLAPADGSAVADQLLNSAIAPSRQLLAVAAEEIRDREQFVLLAEQRLAHDLVLHAVRRAHQADRKAVVVVTGGPGSGKSVIALSLLGELARQGRTVMHATGSRSFTQTLRKVAGKGSARTAKLFAYFNSFMTAEQNGLDVLILDEAHRIRETSVDRYTRKEIRDAARPQVDELMNAARVPVFLLDEHQVVRPAELGTVHEIETWAKDKGYDVHHVDLDAQFRCGGSERYVRWVKALLGLSDEPPFVWEDEHGFEVRIVDSPFEMELLLRQKLQDGYGARLTAGYCWPWSDPRPDGTLVDDVRIGDWAKPWNLKGERGVGDAPPAALWASQEGGFEQVGCVYTAQGFEYDWNGVILGPDLVWRDDRWVLQRHESKDPDFRNTKRVTDSEVETLVRNVYKVLLTRGMLGTLVYSVDAQTRDHLHRCAARGKRTSGLVGSRSAVQSSRGHSG
jgi:hypothetical protein